MQAQHNTELEALRSAFDLLLLFVSPPHQAAILRAGLKELIAEHADTLSQQPRKHQECQPRGEQNWPRLRQQLRAPLPKRRVSARALANDLGISYATCRRMLAPRGGAPGADIQAGVRNWLDTHGSKDSQINSAAAAPAEPEPAVLSEAERGRLAAIVQFDPRSLRNAVPLDTAERATAGTPIPSDDIRRITAFLKHANAAAE